MAKKTTKKTAKKPTRTTRTTKAVKKTSGTTSSRSTGKRTASSSAAGITIEGIPFVLPAVSTEQKQRAKALLKALEKAYPDAHCELVFRSPHELLIATILSAQATDVSVNKATPALFAAFPTPADYAKASPEAIEPYIKTIGLYRNKAKAIHAAMKEIVERYNSQVPKTMDELLSLRGVARKTANVLLSNAFGLQMGFVVDTHVARLAKRLCLVEEGTSITMIERHLMAVFPRQRWGDVSHMLIWHGRRACKARMNACTNHPVCKRFGKCCELNRA